jgi:hypothetical protein
VTAIYTGPLYIGIDPGASGGIAILDAQGEPFAVSVMPATEQDLYNLLPRDGHRVAQLDHIDVRAALEHVWSTPGQGGAFKFGVNVGLCRMALTAAGIPFDQVLPRAWQKEIGVVYPKGATDTEKKNITKRRAQQLFPRLMITHAIADSVLIAEFCRRVHTGRIPRTGKRG